MYTGARAPGTPHAPARPQTRSVRMRSLCTSAAALESTLPECALPFLVSPRRRHSRPGSPPHCPNTETKVGPYSLRAAYSLSLQTGEPPAVKHGASCCKALATDRARDQSTAAAAPVSTLNVWVCGAEQGGRLPVSLPLSASASLKRRGCAAASEGRASEAPSGRPLPDVHRGGGGGAAAMLQ